MPGALGGMPRPERRRRIERVPFGIHAGAGVAVVLVAVTVAATVPVAAGVWRVAPVALALAVFAAATMDPAAVMVVAVVAYLLVIGFLVNRYGVLTWHGAPDMYRLVEIAGSAGAGLALGAVHRWMRRPAALTIPAEWHLRMPSVGPDVVGIGEEGGKPGDRSGVRGGDDRVVRGPRPRGAGGGAAMTATNVVGLVLAAALTVFLVVALLFPERF